MYEAYITRRGGGTPLNFKVVGGTKPSNPKENTIWVSNPNLLDFNNWANNVAVVNGSKVVSGNAIHLTSDGNGDCYTMFYGEGTEMIPCTPGKTYVMEWEHSGDAGYVYFFGTSGQMVNTHSSSGKLEYIPGEGETQFAFRFGVSDPNVTATYSNIRISEKMAEITGCHFDAEEPNVYDIPPRTPDDPHCLVSPKKLSDGDIINFTIPSDVVAVYEAIRIYDPIADKQYCVRQGSGSAVAAWPAGTKVSVRISNVTHQIGDWVGHGTAYLMAWDSYYHQEGTVWFPVGTSSPVAFSATKKNPVMVYPLSAKQHVSGAWVDKEAESYQGGEWHDWTTYIYNLGWDAASGLNVASGSGAPNISVGTSGGYLTLSRPTTWNSWAKAVTPETYDLTGVDTIYCETGSMASWSGSPVRFGVAKSGDSLPTAAVSLTESNTVYSLDVSALSGEYVVGFFGYNGDQDWRWYESSQIKAIWY